MSREKLFSVPFSDFEVQYFRVGGAGGQRRDKVSTGVRVIHPASGARGEAREERSQHTNKRVAWRRCVDTTEFQQWLQREGKRRSGQLAIQEAEIQRAVERAVRPQNLRVEVIEDGHWVPESPSE